MEIKTQNENINNHNVNFVIKPQVFIKQWNQNLKFPQISNVHEST
jgi:poly-D-alanine transfer protein DltD